MRQRVDFIHIGKTGGTAIRHALKWKRPPQHRLVFHPHRVTAEHVAPRPVVFFLRDPLTRYTSGFWSRFRQGLPAHVSPWSDDELRAFVRFRTPNELAEALPDDEAVAAMTAIEHVRSFQSDWLVGIEGRVFHYGFVETLEADFAALCAKLGVTARLPSSAKHAHRNPIWLDSHLSDKAKANLVEWYARDFDLVDRLRRRRSG